MQKRYCTCGSLVWVNYEGRENCWMARFLQEPQHTVFICQCPVCGQRLNIDDLN